MLAATLGTCSSPRQPAGGDARPVLGAPPSPTYPGRGAWECSHAQMWRRRPRPVRSGLGGPERPSCPGVLGGRGGGGVLGGHQVSVLWEQKLLCSARDLAPHPAQPQSGCSLLGWAVERLSATQARSSRVLESRGPSMSSSMTHTPALLVGGWGARPLAYSWLWALVSSSAERER